MSYQTINEQNTNNVDTLKSEFDLSIGSLNVRGINFDVKRKAVFQWAKIKRFDILFLQECYCSVDKEDEWENEWEGKIIYSHGTKHSKGVMMLFSKNFDFQILQQNIDNEGRYIMCKLEVNDEIFWCVNIYAPNTMQEKRVFFENIDSLVEELDISESDNLIIGGDWNSIQNSALDKMGGKIIPPTQW